MDANNQAHAQSRSALGILPIASFGQKKAEKKLRSRHNVQRLEKVSERTEANNEHGLWRRQQVQEGSSLPF